MSCDVGEVSERLERRMSCDVGEVTERMENELCSFSNLSVTSHTSKLILQPFRRFTYVTAHSPAIPLLHLRHSSFSNPSFASPTSQALHLIHLASRPCLHHILNTPVATNPSILFHLHCLPTMTSSPDHDMTPSY